MRDGNGELLYPDDAWIETRIPIASLSKYNLKTAENSDWLFLTRRAQVQFHSVSTHDRN
jgi:hypothetical protein